MKKLLLMIILGIVILAKFAGTYVSGGHGTLAPTNVSFVQSDIGSVEGFGKGGPSRYEFGNGFRTTIERLDAYIGSAHSGNLLVAEGLSANRLRLNGIY